MSWRSQGHNDVLEVSRILNLLFDTNKYMRIFYVLSSKQALRNVQYATARLFEVNC